MNKAKNTQKRFVWQLVFALSFVGAICANILLFKGDELTSGNDGVLTYSFGIGLAFLLPSVLGIIFSLNNLRKPKEDVLK